jgi:penicillin-binding protein 1A
VVKNVTGEAEVRVDRKIKEIFTALNLEKKFSKEQILEAYLNTVAFGPQHQRH